MKLYDKDKELIFLAHNKDPYYDYLTKKILPPIRHKKKGRVLDLGCGTGRNAIICAKLGFRVVGVDSISKALEIAKAAAVEAGVDGLITFKRGDIEQLKPKQLGMFDICILSEVIEHLKDYQRVIDFAYVSLHKGGYLLITTPNGPNQWNIFDEYSEHERRFTILQVRKVLSKFRKIEIISLGFPFHRLLTYLYNKFLNITYRKHDPSLYRGGMIKGRIYYMLLSFLLRIDDKLSFTPWGTTILAISKK